MDKERLATLRRRLQDRRREIVDLSRKADAAIAEIRSEREIEFGDEAQSEEAQTRLARLGDAETSEVGRIDAALRRMDDGVYGTCTSCREPIEPRRLDASPAASLCADCAEQADQASRFTRPG